MYVPTYLCMYVPTYLCTYYLPMYSVLSNLLVCETFLLRKKIDKTRREHDEDKNLARQDERTSALIELM